MARADALNYHNITSSWRKCGLFPFNPEIVISALPVVILQREEDVRKALMPPPPPIPCPLALSSRLTISGNPAPLIIVTPENVTDIKAILKVNEEINSKLNRVLAY